MKIEKDITQEICHQERTNEGKERIWEICNLLKTMDGWMDEGYDK